jgi:hypothetical protein
MIELSQILLVLNILFVIAVIFLTNRMLRAASKFNWNPGDGEVQNKQKFIILKSLIAVAGVALLAALVNALLG